MNTAYLAQHKTQHTVFTRLLAALECKPHEMVLKINLSRP